jgi:hypothetical protein
VVHPSVASTAGNLEFPCRRAGSVQPVEAPVQLRYIGFDQAKNIREYKFEGVAAGEAATHFVVSADVGLFTKYRVALQEGPALCLKRLC